MYKPINKKKCLDEFINSHKNFLNQPIVKSFLNKRENYYLFEQAICYPSYEFQSRVDAEFKKHYRHYQLISYFSNLIYYNSINFDKNIRKRRERERLTIDNNQIDYLNQKHIQFDLLYQQSSSLEDHIETPKLYSAIKQLTDRQRKILELIYVHDYKISYIAQLQGSSQQNISQQHKKALEKLKALLGGE
ncbi:sigma-70 family RNA polymerase sigma factor [Sporolactobacillus shoreicorticis]|uniref:Sigma-70 family RNA polymerase sigma factor n=1 Tax=Sporolactobacillus shoreicorticis TaxID=1923877 RepID=A0ABW5S6L5_9BACL|nr:sigma-70 family RNA polymerase sigma factor [Sporolactobacillus shoreicorticis]MCO7127383.1 sigma-70 family RNA polymerase sigma factor [Sporolactobacillus shoreicorticis]